MASSTQNLMTAYVVDVFTVVFFCILYMHVMILACFVLFVSLTKGSFEDADPN